MLFAQSEKQDCRGDLSRLRNISLSIYIYIYIRQPPLGPPGCEAVSPSLVVCWHLGQASSQHVISGHHVTMSPGLHVTMSAGCCLVVCRAPNVTV